MMMRTTRAFGILALSACASGGGGPVTRTVTDGVVFQGEVAVTGVEVVRSREVVEGEVPRGVDAVWDVLPEVFGRLQMPLERVDPKDHALSTRSVRFRGSLDGSRLSTYFECGQSSMGKTADRYAVVVKVSTGLRTSGADGSILSSVVTATATPDNGGVSVPCDSNGNLEKRIHQHTLVAVANRGPGRG